MELPADLSVYASAALFVLGAYLMAIYLGLIVWTFRDIRSRSRDLLAQILATLLVAVFTLPGLVVYLLVRPRETRAEAYDRALAEEAVLQELEDRLNCPACQRRVEQDFIICPHCHEQLRLRCIGCSRLLAPDWEVCPFCGLFQEPGSARADVETGAAVGSDAEGEVVLEPDTGVEMSGQLAYADAVSDEAVGGGTATGPEDEA